MVSRINSELQVNARLADDIVDPEVTVLSDGDFVVAWGQASGSEPNVFARTVSPDGELQEIQQIIVAAYAYDYEIQGLANGGFVFSSYNVEEGIAGKLFGNTLDPTATVDFIHILGDPDFVIPEGTYGPPVTGYGTPRFDGPFALTALSTGPFVVAWEGGITIAGKPLWGVFTQTFDGTGAALGTPRLESGLAVAPFAGNISLATGPTDGVVVTWNRDGRVNTDVAVLATGELVETWEAGPAGDRDVWAQVGEGPAFRVNTATAMDQTRPTIAALGSGAFVIAWEDQGGIGDGSEILARAFGSTGTPLDDPFLVNTGTLGPQTRPEIAALADDRFVITWSSRDEPNVPLGPREAYVAAQIFELDDGSAFTGTEGADKVTADNADNVIHGLGGDDQLHGYGGNDRIFGGAGNDHLYGGGNDDRLDGGLGDDVLIGGRGNDVFIFRAGFGADRIIDFEGGPGTADVLRFEGLFADATAFRAAAQQVGPDTVITSGADVLTLAGVQLSGLHENDVLLA